MTDSMRPMLRLAGVGSAVAVGVGGADGRVQGGHHGMLGRRRHLPNTCRAT